MTSFISLLQAAICFGTVIMFGSLGEILTEKSGNLNLGVPGIMYLGAISSLTGAFFYERAVETPNPIVCIIISILCAFIASALGGLIYSFLTITLRANQNVTGLALTIFGSGIGNFFGGSLVKLVDSDMPNIILTKTSDFFCVELPFASKLGWFGQIFLSHDFLTYAAIVVALVVSYVLNRTRVGLNLRAIGENPATADAAGINVTKYKYLATCIGSAIAGLGGLQYVMAYANGVWSNNAFGDRGWMAIALVIFALWKPTMAIAGSFLFGALCNVYNYVHHFFHLGHDANRELFNLLPYVVTLLVLIITSMRKKREHQPPQSLGLSYFREER